MNCRLKLPSGFHTTLWLAGLALGCGSFAADIVDPPKSLPILHEVDVLVVGGSSGGVEAALAAARQGAKVFLAAPRPYLGDDLCASLRLWLEPGEEPLTDLSKVVFKPQAPSEPRPRKGYSFIYSTDKPAGGRHPEAPSQPRLTDGLWGSATKESLEFDGPVSISVDLGQERDVRGVTLMAYRRPGDFAVGAVTVSASQDGRTWKAIGQVADTSLDADAAEESAQPLVCAASTLTRYLKLDVKLAGRAQRILLGELLVQGPDAALSVPVATKPSRLVSPMQVKYSLEQALVEAKVPFLYPSVATELLVDAQGRPAGVLMANRSGRQAVIAKVIIDATDRAMVARMTGARFAPYPGGTQVVRRVALDGPARQGPGLSVVKHDSPLEFSDRKEERHSFLEYELSLPIREGNFAAFADAGQKARDMTWTVESTESSEDLFQVPPDAMRAVSSQAGPWPGADKVELSCLKPAEAEHVYVLGGCADLSREAAAKLMRPVNLMALGRRVGEAAAIEAKAMAVPAKVALRNQAPKGPSPAKVMDGNTLLPGRGTGRTLEVAEHALPIWAEYDVVVAGGGTGGAPAAMGAARRGAKTLLIEFTHTLGGVGTAGLISKYYWGNRVGFTAEVDKGVAALSGTTDQRVSAGGWRPEVKSEYFRRELRKAGVDIWFSAMAHGAVVENGRVVGVVVVTPLGRGVVRAKVVIDATGNADLAAAAGAPCRYTDGTEIAVQGTGLPPRDPGAQYVNTDYLFVDDTDVVDIWRAFVTARQKYQRTWDLGQLIDTRERRQIYGDFTLTPLDIQLRRTLPDTIVITHSDFDSHGYTIHPVLLLRPPQGHAGMNANLPYRCLLPTGLDGILVTGLGVSAHRDSLPIIRMQPDIQNQGYAAGVAAAMVAARNGRTRDLDIKALQAHLIEVGNLPQSVLTDQDSFPLPRERFVAAAAKVADKYQDLEVLLTDLQVAKPLLREHLATASDPDQRLIYAHILGIVGDPAGAAVLRQAVQRTPWDSGWSFRGGGQYGASLSPLDSYIIALGRTHDPSALPVLLEKAEALTADREFSHFRAIALALEALGNKSAAVILARLLKLEGLQGHAVTDIQTAVARQRPGKNDDMGRDRELTEISLARALYRCGDHEGIGERVLRQYAQGLEGHYARHAQAVLGGAFKPE